MCGWVDGPNLIIKTISAELDCAELGIDFSYCCSLLLPMLVFILLHLWNFTAGLQKVGIRGIQIRAKFKMPETRDLGAKINL